MSSEKRTGTAGWEQFLVQKKEMLNRFDETREKSKGKPVQVDHGIVAQEYFRRWLQGFLPKRFGVCNGYIASAQLREPHTFRHYDVVIYDQLSSPVLWYDEDPGREDSAKARTIPCEHVYSVLEVKAKLDSGASSAAMDKLDELRQFTFPRSFCTFTIFFDALSSDVKTSTTLNRLIPAAYLPGYAGSLILRGETRNKNDAGFFSLIAGETAIKNTIDQGESFFNSPLSDTIEYEPSLHVGGMLTWSPSNFSRFAFDLLAMMTGNFQSGRLSSWYGASWLDPSRNKKDIDS